MQFHNNKLLELIDNTNDMKFLQGYKQAFTDIENIIKE